jgi:NIPSNAP
MLENYQYSSSLMVLERIFLNIYFKLAISMITCHLRYTIDPYKRNQFEAYGKMWIPLVNRFGGIHHGYFMPHEGANNIAYALFSFPSLAEYEIYRAKILTDPDCLVAFAHAEQTRCILSFERSFLRPVFD